MRPHRKYLNQIFFCFLFFQCVNVYAEESETAAVRIQPRKYEGEFDRAPKSPHSMGGHLVVSTGALQSFRTNTPIFSEDKAWGISGSVEFFFSDHFSLGLGMRRVNYATLGQFQDLPKIKLTIGTFFTRITPISGNLITPYIRLGAGVAGELKPPFIIEVLDDQPVVYIVLEGNRSGFVTQMEAGLSFHLKSGLWAHSGLVYTALTTFKDDIFFIPPPPFESSLVVGGGDIDTIDWRLELALAI